MIFGVDIYEPRIKPVNAESRARGEQAGGHGVILVIVLEHARAADR